LLGSKPKVLVSHQLAFDFLWDLVNRIFEIVYKLWQDSTGLIG